jgi:heat shock protein HtpX
MKRIALFLATNIAIFIVLSITLRILGVDSLFQQGGTLNLTSLAIFAVVFGMGGSFLSLAISKWSAKMMTGAQVIEQPGTAEEKWLVDTVKRQAQQAGIGMPEVAIYDAPDMNAFATGMSRNNALVAVSTGLMHGMSRDEVEAVLAHEVSHIANGDMVTMALIQGIINTFVIFIARIIGSIVDRALASSDEEYTGPGIAYYVTSFIAELIIAFLAQVIVMWFSRQREFRADSGSAQIVGKEKMIAALQRLQQGHAEQLPGQIAAFGISGAKKEGFMSLFLSHPPLEDRIEALRRS